jgi:hypothetical protein
LLSAAYAIVMGLVIIFVQLLWYPSGINSDNIVALGIKTIVTAINFYAYGIGFDALALFPKIDL